MQPWPEANKILFFISDELSSTSIGLRDKYLAIFKGYLPHEMPGTNIFSFNIGYAKDVPELGTRSIAERHINVFFSGNLNESRIPLYIALHP